MEFSEYQKRAQDTALYPRLDRAPWVYPALGLAGESGEVAEKLKKVLRDDNFVISEEKKELLKKELGDVLWYIAQLCSELDINLEDVAQHNLQKLQLRKESSKLQGSGDLR